MTSCSSEEAVEVKIHLNSMSVKWESCSGLLSTGFDASSLDMELIQCIQEWPHTTFCEFQLSTILTYNHVIVIKNTLLYHQAVLGACSLQAARTTQGFEKPWSTFPQLWKPPTDHQAKCKDLRDFPVKAFSKTALASFCLRILPCVADNQKCIVWWDQAWKLWFESQSVSQNSQLASTDLVEGDSGKLKQRNTKTILQVGRRSKHTARSLPRDSGKITFNLSK